MKLRKAETLALVVTALVLAATVGYHLGTARGTPEPVIRTETRAMPTAETETRTAGNEGLVDLNHAGVEELKTLRGVGDVLAAHIVEYREEHGPFRRVEEITLVKGIGNVILEENRSRLYVGEEAP